MQSLLRRPLAGGRRPTSSASVHLVRHGSLCPQTPPSSTTPRYHLCPGASGYTALEPVTQRDFGFPYDPAAGFRVDDSGRTLSAADVVRMLEPFSMEERIARIEAVTAGRTFSVVPVVEGLYDMGNVAAVCRTADALGYGSVHMINKTDNKYKLSQRTAAGADKWLDVRVWDSTAACVSAAKAAGYQVLTTHLTKSSITIQEVDWTRPTAFILGNEKFGVSDEAVALADACVIIPMTGMVESFNISVASALVLWEAQQQRLRRQGRHADLSEEERLALKAVMLSKTVKESRTVLSELLSRPAPQWQSGIIKQTAKKAEEYEAGRQAKVGA
ncbi:hypothetical protein HYH03_002923 [Edaphochlamys debaryana]|uniref:tRNA/rRNA methyltransferase SpoU type domain-containing protein n=1 Tax=Edaphochlamys debaryana TaxID=47281 RepID=A0A836C4W4_9CHLO|nr:hypothetical protein HYH03_002923 [Edaphochlamys debaryana]|eukprot:KAG2499348.1 hypothetical protein HYH03_002923 [Edaphochlamys debaryana]